MYLYEETKQIVHFSDLALLSLDKLFLSELFVSGAYRV